MVKLFRATAILEGISYLLIFGLTMPLKYWAGIGEPNKIVGMAHGVLFILFVLLAAIFCWQKKWGLKRFIILFIASLLPFGTFYADKRYLANVT
jgi:integral membrane protein